MKIDALKVFLGIQRCRQGACSDCPYYNYDTAQECMNALKDDLFDLFYKGDEEDE